MEKEKAKIPNSFRPFFSGKFFDKFVFPASVKQVILNHIKLRSAGFTLIEILIVIAIIGVLVGAFITILNPANQLRISRDARRKSDLKQIQAGLELYRSDRGDYPAEDASHTAAICSGVTLAYPCINPQVTYLQSVPKDPKTAGHYYYCRASCGVSGNRYRIYSCLESSGDRDSLGAAPAWLSCPANSGYFYVENP